MIKRLLPICIMAILLTGCNISTSYGIDGISDTASQDNKVTSDFTSIPGEPNLYYNNATKIVYWIGGSYSVNLVGEDYTTSYMTAYYAPNGLPYIYNTDTGKLEEIQ